MSLEEIHSDHVLLVEGTSDVQFCEAVADDVGIATIQAIPYNGTPNLRPVLEAFLNLPGFDERVRAYAIIRDADEDHDSAMRKVQGALKNYGQPVPNAPVLFAGATPATGFFLFPGGACMGCLEDLCLASVADTPIMDCVESFYECVSKVPRVNLPRHKSKALSMAYLSAMPKLIPNMGGAARKGYWKLGHSAMNEFRTFIETLASF